MARRTGLQTRLARLERNRLVRRYPTIITGIYGEELSGAVTGIEGDDGQRVRLKPGETLPELQRRALATLPGRMLRTLYADSPRIDEAAPVPLEPPKAPIGNPWPFLGVPGIGRIGTRAELEKAGAIHVPPERLI